MARHLALKRRLDVRKGVVLLVNYASGPFSPSPPTVTEDTIHDSAKRRDMATTLNNSDSELSLPPRISQMLIRYPHLAWVAMPTVFTDAKVTRQLEALQNAVNALNEFILESTGGPGRSRDAIDGMAEYTLRSHI